MSEAGVTALSAADLGHEVVPESPAPEAVKAPEVSMRYLARQRVDDILPGAVVTDKDKIAALEAAGVLGVFFTPIAGDA